MMGAENALLITLYLRMIVVIIIANGIYAIRFIFNRETALLVN